MKKVLHVHQAKIKKDEPSIIVRTYKGSRHFRTVEILGPSTLVHSLTPDRCGARVWLTTEAELVCDGQPFIA